MNNTANRVFSNETAWKLVNHKCLRENVNLGKINWSQIGKGHLKAFSSFIIDDLSLGIDIEALSNKIKFVDNLKQVILVYTGKFCHGHVAKILDCFCRSNLKQSLIVTCDSIIFTCCQLYNGAKFPFIKGIKITGYILSSRDNVMDTESNIISLESNGIKTPQFDDFKQYMSVHPRFPLPKLKYLHIIKDRENLWPCIFMYSKYEDSLNIEMLICDTGFTGVDLHYLSKSNFLKNLRQLQHFRLRLYIPWPSIIEHIHQWNQNGLITYLKIIEIYHIHTNSKYKIVLSRDILNNLLINTEQVQDWTKTADEWFNYYIEQSDINESLDLT